MARSQSDFWKRHPNALFAFLLFWSLFAYAWCVGVVVAGEFHWGRGRGGRSRRLITAEADPGLFWSFVALWFVIGTVVLVFNIRWFIRRRRGA